LDHQNNYVECLNAVDNVAKSLNIVATTLNVLHNYHDHIVI